jgi:hypothetical protein
LLSLPDREAGGREKLAAEGLDLRSLFTMSQLRNAASIDVLLATECSLLDLVEAVRALPYGRSSARTVEGMLRERRGTCSTKHLFLAQMLEERFPEAEPLIVHRSTHLIARGLVSCSAPRSPRPSRHAG